jgi:hypothetical protein
MKHYHLKLKILLNQIALNNAKRQTSKTGIDSSHKKDSIGDN